MTWMLLELSKADIRAGSVEALQEEFLAAYTVAYAAAGEPITTAGVFAHPASAHDDERLYYTPSAVAFLRARLEALGASPCEPPPRADTALMVGESGAWELLSDS